MNKIRKFSKIKILLILLVGTLLFGFVLADTECVGRDCSISVSINVAGAFGAFSGSVRDLYGGLIANSHITSGTSYSTVTATGNYNLGIPEGNYNLTASANSYLNQTKTHQLARSGITTNVDFALGRTGLIKGNMVNFWTSAGINNANVSLFLYNAFLYSTLTNANGYYEFSDLAPGYYDISVEAVGYTGNSKPDVHVLGGENATVNFWLW